jgi:hypothetical protein
MLQNMDILMSNEDGCVRSDDDKLSSLRPSTCPTYKVLLYKASPPLRFHSKVYFFVPPDPGDSPAISSLLLSTCKVLGGTLPCYWIGPFPNGFVSHFLSQGISLGFNLLLSFLSFSYIARWFLWWRYLYNVIEHCSIKCLWVIGGFESNLYSRV